MEKDVCATVSTNAHRVHFEDESKNEKLQKCDDGPGWKYQIPEPEMTHPYSGGVYWIQPTAYNQMSGLKPDAIPEVDKAWQKGPVERKEMTENWKQGFFDCFKGDKKVVFTTLVCPDVTLFKILKSTSNSSVLYHSILEPNGLITLLILFLFLKWLFGLNMRAGFIALGVFLAFVCFAYVRRMKRVTNLRSRVREHFGIKGTVLRDYASTCFYGGCVLCQLHEEIEYQKTIHADCEKFQIPINHTTCPNS